MKKKPSASASALDALANAETRLGNALRLYSETVFRFGALSKEDPEEATDNLDRAFDAVLAGLHSLRDAMRAAQMQLDWYAHGDTAACLVVRNARHHNAPGLFESWNSQVVRGDGIRRMAGATLLMASYCLVNEARSAPYFVRLDDFRARLSMPEASFRDYALFERECGFELISAYASRERYPVEQVYVDLTPIVMNAVTRALAALRSAGVVVKGFDSAVYSEHFAGRAWADLQAPVFEAIKIPAV